jgi:Xaa-Pro aminopeptidase
MIKKSEFKKRIKKLQNVVGGKCLDAFIVSDQQSIYYLTGFNYIPFERPFFMIVRPEGEPVLLVPKLERRSMEQISNIGTTYTYNEYPAKTGERWHDVLMILVENNDSIGVEPSLPTEQWLVIQSLSPVARGLVDEIRLVKSSTELQLIETAARLSDLGMQRLLQHAAPGVKASIGYELQNSFREVVAKESNDNDPLSTHVILGVWAAPYSAEPHRIPKINDTIEAGPHVGLSIIRVNGYVAECERTFFVVSPSPAEKEVFSSVMEARRIAFAALSPGVSCAQVDAQVNEFLRSEGFADNLLHRTGHGIGLGGHEGPWVAEGGEHVLKENMVISIEPGIYLPGVGGYRHSDTACITADGYRCLTSAPDSIDKVTLLN